MTKSEWFKSIERNFPTYRKMYFIEASTGKKNQFRTYANNWKGHFKHKYGRELDLDRREDRILLIAAWNRYKRKREKTRFAKRIEGYLKRIWRPDSRIEFRFNIGQHIHIELEEALGIFGEEFPRMEVSDGSWIFSEPFRKSASYWKFYKEIINFESLHDFQGGGIIRSSVISK